MISIVKCTLNVYYKHINYIYKYKNVMLIL